MAETVGLVQKLIVLPNSATVCTWIGTPANAELLWVQRDTSEPPEQGSFENSMVDALVAAAVSGRKVVASHPDNNARITSLTIEP